MVEIGPILYKLQGEFMFLFLIGSIIFTEMFKTMIKSEFQLTEGVHTEARLLLGRSFVGRTQFELLGPRFSQ